MITLAQKFTLDRSSFNQPRLRMDLCGPYACDSIETDYVHCRLHIAGASVSVELPAEAVACYRQSGARSEVVLNIPRQALVPVETAPVLSRRDRREAKRWMAEMESFDRF